MMVEEGSVVEPEVKDPLTECIGEFGKWQLMMAILLSLLNLPCTFHIYAPTFIAAEPISRCTNSSDSPLSQEEWRNLSSMQDNWDDCTIRDTEFSVSFEDLGHVQSTPTRPCTYWQYDTADFGNTIVSEWDLICDRSQLRKVAEMMFLLGVAVGGVVCGFISDRFGRKKTLMISLVAQILLGVAIYWTPWLSLFLVLRSFLGFFSVSVVFSGLVLCMELVGGKWLTICGVSYMFPVPLAYIIMSGLAYVIKDWRFLQLVISLSAVLLLPLWWVLPESPRWLLTMRHKEKVLEVLQQAATFNGKQLPENTDKIIQQSMTRSGEQPPKVSILDLFTGSYLRISLLLYVVWFCVVIVYYGLLLNLSYLGGNVYLNSVISGIVEIPALGVSIFVLLQMGRRWPLSIATGGAGIACLLAALFNKGDWPHLAFAMVGRLFISSSNVVMPIFTAELFPTFMRNLGLGSSDVSAGVALVIVPYIWNMAEIGEGLPLVVLGLCGILGSLSIFLLPETVGLTEDAGKVRKEKQIQGNRF